MILVENLSDLMDLVAKEVHQNWLDREPENIQRFVDHWGQPKTYPCLVEVVVVPAPDHEEGIPFDTQKLVFTYLYELEEQLQGTKDLIGMFDD